jgi:hypothetical protein
MAKRSMDGLPPNLGGLGSPGTRPFTQPKLDDFELDVRFRPKEFDEEPTLISGCLCLGGTGRDTAGGATCIQACEVTRLKVCMSNHRCITQGGLKTCTPCVGVITVALRATCFRCATLDLDPQPDPGTNSPECG